MSMEELLIKNYPVSDYVLSKRPPAGDIFAYEDSSALEAVEFSMEFDEPMEVKPIEVIEVKNVKRTTKRLF